MKLKFAANISTLFREIESLPDRYAAAKFYGFKGVEMQFPYEYDKNTLAANLKRTGLEQVLINSYPGNAEIGEFGFASKPHLEDEFVQSLQRSIEYAKALDCKRLHIIAGMRSPLNDEDAQDKVYVSNLRLASKLLEENNITGLIEPMCPQAKPNYFLNSFDKAKKYLEELNSHNIKLQLDTFHLQMMAGNLTANICKLMPFVGHIQISQVPDRHEPSSMGEVSYPYIFQLLEKLNYDGWVGLEYSPSGATEESFHWIKEYGYSL